MHTRLAPALLAFLVPALAASAAAQEFRAGDIYVNTGKHDFGGNGMGLVRVEPHTGAVSLVTAYDDLPQGKAAAYDPYRDRILVGARFGDVDGVYAIAADGTHELLHEGWPDGVEAVAPTGDGRVYLARYSGTRKVYVLDAQDQLHELLDASGAASFQYGPLHVRLAYEPATESLVLASTSSTWACATGSGADTTLRRVPLAPGGLQVGGPIQCNDVEVTPDTTYLGQFSYGPNGRLVYQADSFFAYTVNLVTLDLLPFFDVVDAPGCISCVRNGTWSKALGAFVYLETLENELRAFYLGTPGLGVVVADHGMSQPSSSHEEAHVLEIGPVATSSGLSVPLGHGAISLASGGGQPWELDLGPAHAGELYLVLGSITGWWPGLTLGGVTLPLAYDGWTLTTLNHPNQAPMTGSLGVLDAAGKATAAFQVPPGLSPALAGVQAHHAAVALTPGAVPTATTNPVALELVP
jgi:hypothetical protein